MTRFSSLAVLLFFLVAAPALANNEIEVACEGTESAGGGATRYQYALKNTSAINADIDYFYVGTRDLVAANYSGWVVPPGFALTGTVADYVTLDNTFPITFSVMYTTGVKTPHRTVPPQTGPATPGAIVFNCVTPPCTITPGQVFTFGFENPNASNDVEWLTHQAAGISQGFSTQPMAGPISVFTSGWVHSPVESPAVPAAGLWNVVLLIVVLALGIAAVLYFRRSKPILEP